MKQILLLIMKRACPKKLSLLKIVVFSWNFSNENVEKSVVYNAVWEDITEIVATVFQIFN